MTHLSSNLSLTRRTLAALLASMTFAWAAAPETAHARAGISDGALTQQDASLVMPLKAGQVLDIVLTHPRLGREGREARSMFDARVLPLMEERPFALSGRVGVQDTIIGKTYASDVEFHVYPDTRTKRALDGDRNWSEMRDYRAEGWRRLDAFSVVIPADLEMRFDPAKSYTLAIAWTHPANPGDYDRYLDGVASEFEAVGARFAHRFRDIAFTTRSGDRPIPPAQIVIVEWNDEEGLQKLLTSDAYRDHAAFFRTGVSDFQFYRLSSPTVS
ncbi:MAG: hypothetical protein AAF311_04920 [Pseudomonadota bacterium]